MTITVMNDTVDLHGKKWIKKVKKKRKKIVY